MKHVCEVESLQEWLRRVMRGEQRVDPRPGGIGPYSNFQALLQQALLETPKCGDDE
jgi:hypothetical protein